MAKKINFTNLSLNFLLWLAGKVTQSLFRVLAFLKNACLQFTFYPVTEVLRPLRLPLIPDVDETKYSSEHLPLSLYPVKDVLQELSIGTKNVCIFLQFTVGLFALFLVLMSSFPQDMFCNRSTCTVVTKLWMLCLGGGGGGGPPKHTSCHSISHGGFIQSDIFSVDRYCSSPCLPWSQELLLPPPCVCEPRWQLVMFSGPPGH